MTISRKDLSVLCVIPARYKSSRFDGKPLVEINGIPMIKRTYLQAKKAPLLDKLLVATDDQRIVDYCESEEIPVILTSSSCLTGTDRLAEVAKSHYYDFYINIQGDEPIIDPAVISQLINEYNTYGEKYIVYNLFKVLDDSADINSDSIVKVIVNEKDEAMYMSRLPVPFSKTSVTPSYRQQIPAYGFTREALNIFSQYDKTINERFEDIELLRFIDLGYNIKMSETFVESIAVDFPRDVVKVSNFLEKNELI